MKWSETAQVMSLSVVVTIELVILLAVISDLFMW